MLLLGPLLDEVLAVRLYLLLAILIFDNVVC